jgi:hypothetical protein
MTTPTRMRPRSNSRRSKIVADFAKLDLARVSPDDARDLIAELELHLVHIDEPHGHRPWDGCDCDCE